jgi:hypothetical protein
MNVFTETLRLASGCPAAVEPFALGRVVASARTFGSPPGQPNRRCPRQESNLRTRFRRALLYPLSYGGAPDKVPRRFSFFPFASEASSADAAEAFVHKASSL